MHRAIYVSSKLRHRTLWVASGLPIVSSWIHGVELPADQCSAMWDRYRDEVDACDGFVLYAEDEDRLKGCMLELGMAFGRRVPVVIAWAGTIDDLVDKIGTIVHHEDVEVVRAVDEVEEALERIARRRGAS